MLIDAPYEDARRTSGVYCLVLWLPRACHITLTRRGTCRIERGWYVYTGSAKRNLRPRLLRHLRRHKRFHWHIDCLRAAASVQQVWVWPWTAGGECRTNAMVRHMPDATYPVRGFGASDCRCFAHLVSFPSEPMPPDHGAPFTCRVRGGRVLAASIRRHLAKGYPDLVLKSGPWPASCRAGLTPPAMRRIL
jgi:Uri superfamily endonuclease